VRSMATTDELKALGNAAFSAGRYSEAVTQFSAAVALDPGNHVLYSNRSAAQVRGALEWPAPQPPALALSSGCAARARGNADQTRSRAQAGLANYAAALEDARKVCLFCGRPSSLKRPLSACRLRPHRAACALSCARCWLTQRRGQRRRCVAEPPANNAHARLSSSSRTG